MHWIADKTLLYQIWQSLLNFLPVADTSQERKNFLRSLGVGYSEVSLYLRLNEHIETQNFVTINYFVVIFHEVELILKVLSQEEHCSIDL